MNNESGLNEDYLRGIGTNHRKAFESNLNRGSTTPTKRSKISNFHDWKTEFVSMRGPDETLDPKILKKNEL